MAAVILKIEEFRKEVQKLESELFAMDEKHGDYALCASVLALNRRNLAKCEKIRKIGSSGRPAFKAEDRKHTRSIRMTDIAFERLMGRYGKLQKAIDTLIEADDIRCGFQPAIDKKAADDEMHAHLDNDIPLMEDAAKDEKLSKADDADDDIWS